MSALPENQYQPPPAPPGVPVSAEPVVEPQPEPRRLYPVVDVEETAPIPIVEVVDEVVPDDGVEVVDEQPSAARTWVKAAFVPASGLWTERQPTLSEELRRARQGGQVGDKGLLRQLSVLYGYFAFGGRAVFRTAEWIVVHPARLAVVLAIVLLILTR